MTSSRPGAGVMLAAGACSAALACGRRAARLACVVFGACLLAMVSTGGGGAAGALTLAAGAGGAAGAALIGRAVLGRAPPASGLPSQTTPAPPQGRAQP